MKRIVALLFSLACAGAFLPTSTADTATDTCLKRCYEAGGGACCRQWCRIDPLTDACRTKPR